jgi:hypothetical protein
MQIARDACDLGWQGAAHVVSKGLHGMRMCLEEVKRSGTESRYFQETPGIEETRKWYGELGNKELKEIEAKCRI